MTTRKLLSSLPLLVFGSVASAFSPKVADIPADATISERIAIAASVVPNEQQLHWQQRTLTAFLHFGINTFTDREWGDGTEDPALFNPTDLNTDQWVKTLHDAGFEMVILTAKHHDGFCLWPTATTTHSVASSPWRNGKGDVVADLRASCDKYGMKLGIYLSPWDRNAPCYGDSERYNDMFVTQLTELLTQYGTIDEVWFDGACGEGPNGKKQQYDWLRYRDVMRRLQPNAVLAITGDDVRWVGNEGGVGRETEWSVTPLVPSIFPESDSINAAMGIDAMSTDIGSRKLLEQATRLYWWPSEVDVSIRPGWFYHEREQPKSLAELSDIYLNSVGRNSVLLLNIPPDSRGLIPEADSLRLMEMHRWIDDSFSDNRLGVAGSTVNCVSLTEDITHGQRVEQFDVIGYHAADSTVLASGTTIGHRRILTFPAATVDSVALRITRTRATPHAIIDGIYNIRRPTASDSSATMLTDAPTVIPDTAFITQLSDATGIFSSFSQPSRIGHILYTPDPKSGKIVRYTIMALIDGSWIPVCVDGELGNIQASPTPRIIDIELSAPAKAIVVRVSRTVDGPLPTDIVPLQFYQP